MQWNTVDMTTNSPQKVGRINRVVGLMGFADNKMSVNLICLGDNNEV